MILDQFSMKGKTVLVTGGQGLMGQMICETVRELRGTPISVDKVKGADIVCNLTNPDEYSKLYKIENLDVLVNNAVGNQSSTDDYLNGWATDLDIGLTAATRMIDLFRIQLQERKGVILNIGSDLSLIAPTQSLYKDGWVKPLSYSVVKHGIVGLTRYIAATFPIRCNCLCPGGIDRGQKFPDIPMKRLARIEEMKGPVAFLISNASSYMTGATLVVDGGRTII